VGSWSETLYRIDTDWARFYGAVVGNRPVLVPAEGAPGYGRPPGSNGPGGRPIESGRYDTGHGPQPDLWRAERAPVPDRGPVVRANPPAGGDPDPAACRVGISVGGVTLGSFTPARVTGTVSTSPAAPTAVASATLTLPDGTVLRLSELPLTALITGDGGPVVIP